MFGMQMNSVLRHLDTGNVLKDCSVWSCNIHLGRRKILLLATINLYCMIISNQYSLNVLQVGFYEPSEMITGL